MATLTQRPAETEKQVPVRRSILALPELWGAIAIGFMWLAVLFDAVYGGDFVTQNASQTQSTTVPSAVFVSLFAFLGSVAVAKRAFRRGDEPRS